MFTAFEMTASINGLALRTAAYHGELDTLRFILISQRREDLLNKQPEFGLSQ